MESNLGCGHNSRDQPCMKSHVELSQVRKSFVKSFFYEWLLTFYDNAYPQFDIPAILLQAIHRPYK